MLRRRKSTTKREPGNRRVRAAVAALLFASVGAAGLVAFVKGAEERALAGEQLVDVVVVKQAIEAGTAADELKGVVGSERVPAKTRTEGAVADLAPLGGRVSAVDLLPGEQLTTQRFVTPEEFGRNHGRITVPEGLLEVTVSLAPERAVGGVLRPGDTVGVIASFDPFDGQAPEGEDVSVVASGKTPESTHLILHKVLVTNVQSTRSVSPGFGGSGDDDDSETTPAPTDNLLVTLALNAPSVERVVFSAEHGSLWLSYEPEEAPEEGTRVQTRGSVYR